MKLKWFLYFSLINYISNEEATENSELAEQLYKQLFKHKRADQIEAIKSLRSSLNYEKQYSMIVLMTEKIFGTIQEARASIESSSFIPGISEFPTNERVRDSLSNILENTALFGEIVLRFPDVAQVVLKTNNNWDVLLQWGIAFSNQVKYLLDKSTIKLLYLVSQELNHVERDPNYVNPYRKENWMQTLNEDIVPVKKKKKKEIKKGPQLRKIEL
ncbi:ERK and JNK pathways, inhibitor [Popillia japonica]|uniref:ERK and JNK pathways, inhibitor n=1 Tax=Popillia japonica TaxID=7064 RepID=A0AAW1LDT4_POPJA